MSEGVQDKDRNVSICPKYLGAFRQDGFVRFSVRSIHQRDKHPTHTHTGRRNDQALEVGLANEDVQWYLSGASAMDGVFTHNESYHDSQLAYDFRGMLGVRACPAIEGEEN